MTKLENRCANCGGKFGLVYHHHWGLRFCRKGCKDNFLAKTARVRRWFGWVANRPIRGRSEQAEQEAESSCDDTRPPTCSLSSLDEQRYASFRTQADAGKRLRPKFWNSSKTKGSHEGRQNHDSLHHGE